MFLNLSIVLMYEPVQEFAPGVKLIVYLVFNVTASSWKISTSCFLQFVGDPADCFLAILQ